MKKSIVALSLASLFAWPAFTCDENGETGFVPQNDLYIGTEALDANMTKKDFEKIIDDVSEIYAPIVESKGATLNVVKKWDDGTVNAYAMRKNDGKIWEIHMFGGLARHKTITNDAFAAVVCHELGHHLGGAPKKTDYFGRLRWASNEGQSDYWGINKCLKQYFEKDDNIKIIGKMSPKQPAVAACNEVYSDPQEVAICIRSSMAGLSLGNLFRALRRMTTELSFTTPSKSVVKKTSHSHPQPQCRLDTYFNGALCDKDPSAEVSDSDANVGFCSRSENYVKGVRPLCWYKPL